MNQLTGQAAIVFGGGEVARGIAVRFAREGAIVAVVDSDADAGIETTREVEAQGGRTQFIHADATVKGEAANAVDAAIEAFGRVDILVNAIDTRTEAGPLETKSERDFETQLNGDFIAAVRAMQAIYPHMKANGGGRIVNVGSIYGANAYLHVADTAARDMALQGLTRSAGSEWAKDKVLVNFLAPAIPDVVEFHAYRDGRPELVDRLVKNTPLERAMDPVEDIGGAALYLVSDEACFVVGHTVYADGGQHLVAAVMEPGFEG